MVNLILTDDEATTIAVALDFWQAELESQQKSSLSEEEETTLTEEIGSAEWCWQKVFTAQQAFRNSIADAVGEGQPSSSIDPYDLKGLEY